MRIILQRDPEKPYKDKVPIENGRDLGGGGEGGECPQNSFNFLSGPYSDRVCPQNGLLVVQTLTYLCSCHVVTDASQNLKGELVQPELGKPHF